MAPHLTTTAVMHRPSAKKSEDTIKKQNVKEPEAKEIGVNKPEYKWKIAWVNVIAFIYLHGGSLYGIYLILTTAKVLTTLFAFSYMIMSGLGITAGAHRLWAHKTYKAKWPLRLILATFQLMAFQNHIYEWARDHRVHHKFTDTDADPHNAKRGFFFSHIGWLMIKKHPDVKAKGKTIDMSDLEADWVVVWQRRTFLVLMPLFCFVIPAWIPVRLWGESLWVSWFVASVTRYTISLNFTWLINSATHMWGMKPYDKSISPSQNPTVNMFAMGEGWHNYHHVFPWDYKAAEMGSLSTNMAMKFIDFFAKIGWAYDMKTVSPEMILQRVKRTGDGTWGGDGERESAEGGGHHHDGPMVWGWDDKEMPEEDIKGATIINHHEE